jgi:hypothetical protein
LRSIAGAAAFHPCAKLLVLANHLLVAFAKACAPGCIGAGAAAAAALSLNI